jgi:hypothetical protein
MRQWAGILAAVAILGVATGIIDYLHVQQVERQTQAWLATQRTPGQPLPVPIRHDTANCVLCLVLHLPLAAQASQAMIAALGLLFVLRFLRPSDPTLIRLTLPMDCRGPPRD